MIWIFLAPSLELRFYNVAAVAVSDVETKGLGVSASLRFTIRHPFFILIFFISLEYAKDTRLCFNEFSKRSFLILFKMFCFQAL